MDIIPVLDLMRGLVVHGIAGRRESYQPLRSRWVAEGDPARRSDPLRVAQALGEQFGHGELYVADLDAIAGATPAWDTYRGLLAQGWRLRIDAGIDAPERGRELANFTHQGKQLAAVIVGLESLAKPEQLVELIAIASPERLVLSLDLRHGLPDARYAPWCESAPIEIAQQAMALGVRRFIVLDLAAVGVGRGVPTLDLCRALRAFDANLEIVTGGGVRGLDDLTAVAATGCDGVLVATALHDGRLSPDEVSRWRAASTTPSDRASR